MELASALIDKRTKKFDPSLFKDRYDDALRALIDAKRGKKGAVVETDSGDTKPSNVIDLMAALKASIEKGGGSDAPAAPDIKPRAAKPPARRAPPKAAARKRA